VGKIPAVRCVWAKRSRR